MPVMYKLGCQPIDFHESNYEQQYRNGWTLEPPEVAKGKRRKKIEVTEENVLKTLEKEG